MANALLNQVVDYLNKQKSWGKKEVFRTSIFNVMEERSGRMFTPKDLPRGLLLEAATLTNATYLVGKNGKSKIIF